MSLSINKKALGLLLAILGAFVAYAALAPAANATQVAPVNQQITLSNTSGSDFIPNNANSEIGTKCFDVEARVTFPETRDRHANQGPGTLGGPTGTFSGQHVPLGANGDGSVIVALDENPRHPSDDRAPVFEDCFVWHFGINIPLAGAVVTTTDANGAWTLAAHASDAYDTSTDRDAVLAIGVPPEGAEIVLGATPPCTVTVSTHPDWGPMASSVMAEHQNPNKKHPAGFIDVDGQIDYVHDETENCPPPTPAQYESTFVTVPPVVIGP